MNNPYWIQVRTSMSKAIFWFRRDLRLDDNTGLHHALTSGHDIIPVFIFDKEILDKLEDQDDARVTFIHQEISQLKNKLKDLGSDLRVYYGSPEVVYKEIYKEFQFEAIYTNRDYEPYALSRDNKIKVLCDSWECGWHDYKDHVIFDGGEVLKDDGDPYVVFTPYSRKWKERMQKDTEKAFRYYHCEEHYDAFCKLDITDMIQLSEMGFKTSEIDFPSREVNQGLIKSYDKTRNFPAIDGTSRLGIHFRFGTISIREKARKAGSLNDTFLNELIWRDFYSMILQHFPRVEKEAFRSKYDRIEWRNNEYEFTAWCKGETGYPIVDAGMRELNTTGYMHNRVRMVTASFLTKHLLIDWRWGEAYFARKLLDFDLASNNGGWQWAAGSGTDAAPYFRIFNPESQQKKFDKDFKYIKEFVEEFGTDQYPEPIVDHKEARQRCLETYKRALN